MDVLQALTLKLDTVSLYTKQQLERNEVCEFSVYIHVPVWCVFLSQGVSVKIRFIWMVFSGSSGIEGPLTSRR